MSYEMPSLFATGYISLRIPWVDAAGERDKTLTVSSNRVANLVLQVHCVFSYDH